MIHPRHCNAPNTHFFYKLKHCSILDNHILVADISPHSMHRNDVSDLRNKGYDEELTLDSAIPLIPISCINQKVASYQTTTCFWLMFPLILCVEMLFLTKGIRDRVDSSVCGCMDLGIWHI